MRLGASFFPMPGAVTRIARSAEQAGLDTVTFGDSPLRAGELFASLAEAVLATSSIEIAAGVTNPVTRHPSVMASGFGTLQVLSGGRVVCGIGRGDSAVRHVGQQPAPVPVFREFVSDLRGYLAGQERYGSTLDVAAEAARRGHRQVPIEIASSGPRTRRVAIEHADRIAIGTGSDPEHVRRLVDEVTAELAAAGRDRGEVLIGAYFPAGLHSDLATARRIASYITAKIANFSVMAGQGGEARKALPEWVRSVASGIGETYSYAGDPGSNLAGGVSTDLVDWMAVLGDADRVTAHLAALQDAGLDYVTLMTGFHQLDPQCQEQVFTQLTQTASNLRATRATRANERTS